MEQNTIVGETKDTFILNLKFVLNEMGLKPTDLAARLEMSPQAISNMINKPGGISTDTMDKIAGALGLKGPDLASYDFKIKYLSQKK